MKHAFGLAFAGDGSFYTYCSCGWISHYQGPFGSPSSTEWRRHVAKEER